MNKIVRENYPAANLPEELRPSTDPNARVTVTIEEVERQITAAKRRSLASYVGTGRNVHGSPEEVIRHIRDLREDR